ncbi:hypothetical protein FJZ17_03960 [Candidatus Pacearchaeota archaeon]|nr:hypothetical protein [Candidatus Pacearchaeota archaeon]
MKINKNLSLIFLSVVLTLVLALNFVVADIYVGEGAQCSGPFINPPGNYNTLCSQNGYDTHRCLCLGATNGYCTACDDTVDGFRTCFLKDPTCAPACTKVNWYLDADNDGYYSSVINSCTSPGNGWTTNTKIAGDCNDNNAAIRPGALEVCNGVDDDCDGIIDEGNVCNNQTNVTNQTIPLVFISNPVNGFTYNYTNHLLGVSSNQEISSWKYSLNNQTNVTFGMGAIINALNGTNNLVVYGTNANGTGMASIVFYVNPGNNSNNQTNQTNSSVPMLNVFSPINNWVYNSTSVLFNASSNQVVNWIYNLNGINTSVSNVNQINTLLNALNGTNNLKVYISNVNGSASANLNFFVNTSSNNSGPLNAPVITIHSPIASGNYTSNITTLNVSSNQVVNWIYNINGTNVSAGQSNFLITTFKVVNGTNTLRVYGTNANGTGFGLVTFIVKLGFNNNEDDDDDKDDGNDKTEEDCLLSSMPYELSYESDILSNYTIDLTPKKAVQNLDVKFWLYWMIIAVLVLLIIIIIVYIARSA